MGVGGGSSLEPGPLDVCQRLGGLATEGQGLASDMRLQGRDLALDAAVSWIQDAKGKESRNALQN